MPFVFDAYGTLLDIESAAKDASTQSGSNRLKSVWSDFAVAWRERQLRYTWLCSMMDRYEDFWALTVKALDATLVDFNLNEVAGLRNKLLLLYQDLAAFDEAPSVLDTLRGKNEKLAVLSNANLEMLERAVSSAQIAHYFDDLISVDKLKCYKPESKVYKLVIEKYDCAAHEVKFFSANNWDISGAKAFGFETIWVNRNSLSWDNLPGRPDHTVKSLLEGIKIFVN